MADTPKVSVYMASFNGERYVEAAVRSILDQSFRDLELVVVDDGSRAPTLQILRLLAASDPRMKLHECAHRGLVGTLNHAISLCRGSYLARMDHDDISVPHRIERQVQYLDSHPDVVACGSDIRRMDAAGTLAPARKRGESRLRHRPDLVPPEVQWMPGPTPMIRADALRRAGGYRPQFVAAEDRDLCWRLGEIGRCVRLSERLLNYRDHAHNTSVLQRRTQLFSHLLADLSAVARHYGLGDGDIVASIVPGGDYLQHVEAYRRLLAEHYPVETYWLMFLSRQSAWAVAGFATGADFLETVVSHWRARPFDAPRALLVARTWLAVRRRRGTAPSA